MAPWWKTGTKWAIAIKISSKEINDSRCCSCVIVTHMNKRKLKGNNDWVGRKSKPTWSGADASLGETCFAEPFLVQKSHHNPISVKIVNPLSPGLAIILEHILSGEAFPNYMILYSSACFEAVSDWTTFPAVYIHGSSEIVAHEARGPWLR